MCVMARRFLGVVVFVLCSAVLPSTWAAVEWVDMGPISGSVQGSVWSKVVDEVGNTQGRAETWTLNPGVPSKVVITLRAPDPRNLELRINLRHLDGDTGFLRLPELGKEIPGGYQQVIKKVIPGSKPSRDGSALPSISVMPTSTSTNQRYQLTVEIVPLDGPLPTTAAPSGGGIDALAAPMEGQWTYTDRSGKTETFEFVRSGNSWLVVIRDSAGVLHRQKPVRQDGQWLEIDPDLKNGRGNRLRMLPDGRLEWDVYILSNRAPYWTGQYVRTAGSAPPATFGQPAAVTPVQSPSDGIGILDLSGTWQHGKNGEHWTISRQPDGRFLAIENGYGNARGTLTILQGGQFRIDHTYTNSQGQCTGHYDLTIDPDGKRASGSWHDSCLNRSGTMIMKRVSAIPSGFGDNGILAPQGFTGIWTRTESGRVVDKITVTPQGAEFELAFQESENGPVVSRGRARQENGWLIADSWQLARNTQRVVKMRLNGTRSLYYESRNPDGSAPWSGEFQRR